MASHLSRGSGHGLGLQKCEARAVGPRKPCGGFIKLGLTGLGLGWPTASRPGRHITTRALSGEAPHSLFHLPPSIMETSSSPCRYSGANAQVFFFLVFPLPCSHRRTLRYPHFRSLRVLPLLNRMTLLLPVQRPPDLNSPGLHVPRFPVPLPQVLRAGHCRALPK